MTDDDEHFRSAQRTHVELRASYRRDAPGAVLEKGGRVSDLSMGGAFVEAREPPAEGQLLWLTFSSPTAWDPLELPAEVRWRKPGGFGVRFRALTAAQAQALHALVQGTGFGEE